MRRLVRSFDAGARFQRGRAVMVPLPAHASRRHSLQARQQKQQMIGRGIARMEW
jgi:hypothetical protein